MAVLSSAARLRCAHPAPASWRRHHQAGAQRAGRPFQSFGGYAAGLISEEQRCDIVRNSCPGPGACGGMYTANTMASAIEALGMSLPYSSSTPAEDPLKRLECRMAGRCGQAAGKADGVGRVKFLVLTAV